MTKTTKSFRISPELLEEILKDCKSDSRNFSQWLCIAAREKLVRDRRQKLAIKQAREEGHI